MSRPDTARARRARTPRLAALALPLAAAAACADTSVTGVSAPTGLRHTLQPAVVHVGAPTLLGPLAGKTSAYALAVAPSGNYLIGVSFVSGTDDANGVGTVWAGAAAPTTIGGFGFSAERKAAGAYAVNAAGLMVGVENVADVLTAVLWRPASPGDFASGTSVRVAPSGLPDPGAGGWWNSAAEAIGPTGLVGGRVYGGGTNSILNSRCFAWVPSAPNGSSGAAVTLDPAATGSYCRVVASAGAAHFVGTARTDRDRAFRWTPAAGNGSLTWLFAGDDYNVPTSANAAGQVAGVRRAVAGGALESYVWTPDALGATTGVMQSLGVNARTAVLNDAGYVVYQRPNAANVYEATLRIDGVDHVLPAPAGAAGIEAYALSEPVAVSATTTRLVVGGWTHIPGSGAQYQAVRWEVLLERPAQPGTVGGVVDAVNDLVTGGALPAGTANALLGKLEAAQRQIERGQVRAARNLLAAVLNEVNALVASGRLTAAQAAPLLAAVQAAMAAL